MVVNLFLASGLVERPPGSPHAALDQERLRKGRFWHAADAAGIGFDGWMIQEGLSDLAWARVGRAYAVAHPWKQKEEASAERLRC
jgi:hypothetical protein